MAELTIEGATTAPTLATEGRGQPPPAAGQPRPARPQPDFDPAAPQAFQFTGTGSEYFRIWVVNLLLTILTAGIYSAWAKVRRLQYLYRNTRVNGTVFDYHGNPIAILKGRIVALVLVAAYHISFDISPVVAIAVGVVLCAVMPWLLARAFRFKMANSSYGGVHFHFRGTGGEAYRKLVIFPVMLGAIGLFAWSVATSFSRNPGIGFIVLVALVPMLALAATVPLAHYFLKRYQHEHADFGTTAFYFHGNASGFFKTYAKAVGFLFLGSIPAGIFAFLTARVYALLADTLFGWLFTLLYGVLSAYAFYLFVRAYLESRIQNMVWNHTEIGQHRFESKAGARKLLWIHATNLLLITFTLGLYKPFATIRLVRYRVESLSLVPGGPLEDFMADRMDDRVGAAGQEAGDLFDIDIAL
ncbi:YjgN family protein [Noviherbaspirillum saxi]|uniref:DUF898 domain-containing protein n=1 Tax=Noviherbaspirillum saxi TaxID=2320863 RepID=A0A3A3FTV7_9BURK|nr:YjgN family protein [Noviherbaspirillum saxi]RJF97948.1 DUF898 domain-containing protein [Noviherbaspirillum saxi]